MLFLQHITLTHFKNYAIRNFSFTEKVVAICGNNGKGKTNLLDAIYYCCFTKSYFSSPDTINTAFHQQGFRLEAHFDLHEKNEKVVCIYKNQAKKEFFLNDILYDKLSKHVGFLPAVMIAPDDIALIIEGSEVRRKYIDALICQLNQQYLQQLIVYNKVLQQRNSLLKKMADEGKTDESLLEVLNEQLIPPGNYIYEQRSIYALELKGLVENFYAQLSGNSETVFFNYESQLQNNSFEQLLKKFRTKDGLLQRTSVGIHKDDLKFEIKNQPFKLIASQGQRKSLLFALKLAEFQLLKKYKHFSPILLLDDVFEKLDEQRMQQLLHWVCNENEGQVFITDTHAQRIEEALTGLNTRFQCIKLS